MLNKEILKEYIVRKCPRLAYIMGSKEYAFSLLKKIIESGIEIPDEVEEDSSDDHEQYDRLVDFIKYYPDAYELLQQQLKNKPQDMASNIIEEMKNFQEVSELSRRYFSLLYPGQCARADTHDMSLDGQEIRNLQQVEKNTQKLLANPKIRVIFEGQVSGGGLLARWDVLIKNKTGYSLYEVKGSTSIYTKNKTDEPHNIKKPFLYDIAFQYEVYKQAGIAINEINFLYLNKEFTSTKERLTYPLDNEDCLLLFQEGKVIFNHTKKDKILIPIKQYLDDLLYVKKDNENVTNYIQRLLNIQQFNQLPDVELIYGCRKEGGCLFKNDCHTTIDENHLLSLTCYGAIGGNWRYVSELMETGIKTIPAIPDAYVYDHYPEYKEDKRMIARLQIDYCKHNKIEDWLDIKQIQRLLTQNYRHDYLMFFDFETFSYPIPIVENCHPWERVCCQYSMHIVQNSYDLLTHDFAKGTGGKIQHYEFIGHPQKDKTENPEIHLIETLQTQLQSQGIDVEKSDYRFVVYNQNFEKGELARMAKKYPQFAGFLNQINERVIDLLDFFVQGHWYQQNFHGRVSLKVTQPNIIHHPLTKLLYQDHLSTLLKTLDYKQGIVQNGGVALDVYQSLLRKVLSYKPVLEEHDALIQALLAYCKIDSWGTVVLYDIIRKTAQMKGD